MTATDRPPPKRPNKMTLDAVNTGKRPGPDRILLYGVEGVGKSTWAAAAPSTIFLPIEDGVRHLDVASFPAPKTYSDVTDAVAVLTNSDHPYKTLAVDTVDALEGFIVEDVCRRNGWDTPESPGFGKGWVAVSSEWRKFLLSLDRLVEAKQMEIILIGHSTLRVVTNPAGPDYSRYELKLQKMSGPLVREWAESVLFATYEDFVGKAKGEFKAKVTSNGRRILHTQRAAAWDAKCRHSVPPVLALSYSEYVAAREAGRVAAPGKLYAEAQELLLGWGPEDEVRAKFAARLEAIKTDAVALAKAVDILRTKITEKENA